jgi:hypothetical protein
LKLGGRLGLQLLLFALVAHLGEHELERVDELDVAQHVFLIHQLDELIQHPVFLLLLLLGRLEILEEQLL